ncbi:MAG: hypothetical protein Kow00105_07220 [Phycisphaeraceae bacterium]
MAGQADMLAWATEYQVGILCPEQPAVVVTCDNASGHGDQEIDTVVPIQVRNEYPARGRIVSHLIRQLKWNR